MSLRLNISQIHLPNPKQAQNFVSIFEETIRTDEPVYLFLMIEIRGDKKNPAAKKALEYQKIIQGLVHSLKQTYLSERIVTEATFEKALANLNNELSTLAGKGLVGWYKKLNALVAVVSKSNLSVSVVGSFSALLLRDKIFSPVAEPAPDKLNPIKTFANFSAGSLVKGDCVILATASVFNYISIEKLKLSLSNSSLEEVTKEILETLKTDSRPSDSFAAFFLAATHKLSMPDSELHPLVSPAGRTILEDRDNTDQSKIQTVLQILKKIAGLISQALLWLGASLIRLVRIIFRSKSTRSADASKSPAPISSKKSYLVAFALVVALLAINLIFFNLKNGQKQTQNELKKLLTEAGQHVTEAEAAMIYNNQNKALTEVNLAQAQITELQKSSSFKTETQELAQKVEKLSNQLNKVTPVNEIESLGQFSQTPDRLIKTPDGFLGFNSYTDGLEKFDPNSRQTSSLTLQDKVLENLVDGEYFPQLKAVVFTSESGRFYLLDTSASQLKPMFATSTPSANTSLDIAAMSVYDNKIYAIDKLGQQIRRYTYSKSGWNEGDRWLKSTFDFTAAQDIAVDGNLFVLNTGSIAKFTRGAPQPFDLPPLKLDIKKAKRLFTAKDMQNLYIADPENSRVLVLTKNGQVATQLVNGKFSDLKDIWVDETAKTIYVLYGNELGRFKF